MGGHERADRSLPGERRRMWHSFKPSGKWPLLAIQVYAPPGPELRFKPLAGKEP